MQFIKKEHINKINKVRNKFEFKFLNPLQQSKNLTSRIISATADHCTVFVSITSVFMIQGFISISRKTIVVADFKTIVTVFIV